MDTTDKAAPIVKSISQQQPPIEPKTITPTPAIPAVVAQSTPTPAPSQQAQNEAKVVKSIETKPVDGGTPGGGVMAPTVVAQITDNLNKLDINDKNNNLNKPPTSESTPLPPPLTVKPIDLNCWTPENKEGKKRYDRDFLISFKDKKLSRTFPEVLKAYSDILFSAENNNNMNMMMMNSNQMMSNKGSMQGNYDNYNKNKFGGSMGGDGGGSYGKGSMNKNKNKGSMNMNKMNKGSEGDRHQPPAVINLPEKIMLNTVENPYVIKKKTQVELNEHEELLREVRNILNKLTPQNLQKLTGDLINLSINNEDRLKGSIDIIFEKSIDEQVFSQIYANLCKVRNYEYLNIYFT